jgi:DNA-binding transcriptional regulator PaaX
MPVILATQEAEIRRIMVQSQPEANSSTRSSLENTLHKNRAGGVAQGSFHPPSISLQNDIISFFFIAE